MILSQDEKFQLEMLSVFCIFYLVAVMTRFLLVIQSHTGDFLLSILQNQMILAQKGFNR